MKKYPILFTILIICVIVIIVELGIGIENYIDTNRQLLITNNNIIKANNKLMLKNDSITEIMLNNQRTYIAHQEELIKLLKK